MKTIIGYALAIIACIAVGGLGLYAGYMNFNDGESLTKPELTSYAAEVAVNETEKDSSSSSSLTSSSMPYERKTEGEKIKPSTKMVYEYCYNDGNIVRTYGETPYFLLDATKEKMLKEYPDWEIISFSSDQVVMRKKVEKNGDQNYMVGIEGGYVAVFYQSTTSGSSLKELTNTPIEALLPEERQRLKDGIVVTGEEQLLKVLEDYGS